MSSPYDQTVAKMKTTRRTRTPAERATDLLVTYLGRKQLLEALDLPDAELLQAVRAALAYSNGSS